MKGRNLWQDDFILGRGETWNLEFSVKFNGRDNWALLRKREMTSLASSLVVKLIMGDGDNDDDNNSTNNTTCSKRNHT